MTLISWSTNDEKESNVICYNIDSFSTTGNIFRSLGYMDMISFTSRFAVLKIQFILWSKMLLFAVNAPVFILLNRELYTINNSKQRNTDVVNGRFQISVTITNVNIHLCWKNQKTFKSYEKHIIIRT